MRCSNEIWSSFGALALFIVFLFQEALASTYDMGHGHFREHSDRPGDRPIFRPTDTNVTFGPGDTAHLKCQVDNLGTRSLTWRKEGDMHPLTIDLYTFVSDTRISVDYMDRTKEWTLEIENVRPEDEGMYHCTIVTKDATDNTYKVKLNVKKEIEQGPAVLVYGKEFVEKSQRIYLTCNATGKPDPPTDVTWYKDGAPIDSSVETGILITKKIDEKMLTSTMLIQNSQLSDQGNYICRSANGDYAQKHVHVVDVQVGGPTKRESGKTGSGNEGHAQPVHGAASRHHVTLTMLTLFLSTCLSLSSHWTLRS